MNSLDRFNILLERIETLDEMADNFKRTVRGAASGEDGLNLMLKAYRNERTGKPVGAVSRVKNLIVLRALYDKDYINDEQFQALAKKATSSNYISNTLKEINPEAHDKLFGSAQESDDIVKHIKLNAKDMLNFGLTNLQGKNYVEVQEDEPEDPDAKELEDEVTSEVISLAKGLTSDDVEGTILDFDDVDVALDGLENKDAITRKLVSILNGAGYTADATGAGFNVEAPIGSFGTEEKVQDLMAGLIVKHFPGVDENLINVKLNTTIEDAESFNDKIEVEEYYPDGEGPDDAGKILRDDEDARQHEKDKAGPTIPGEYESDEEGGKIGSDFKAVHAKVVDGKSHLDYDDHYIERIIKNKLGREITPYERRYIMDEYGYSFHQMGLDPLTGNMNDDIGRDEDAEGNDESLDTVKIGDKLYEVGSPDPNNGELIISIEKSVNGYMITTGQFSSPEDFVTKGPNSAVKAGGYALSLDGQPMYVNDLLTDHDIKLIDVDVSNGLSREELEAEWSKTLIAAYIADGQMYEDELLTDHDIKLIDVDVSNGLSREELEAEWGKTVIAAYIANGKARGKFEGTKLAGYAEEDGEGSVKHTVTENFENQRHLNVTKNSTSMYLTEQVNKDKRNKGSRKDKDTNQSQSFRERYKPKTHWQLEELRRYGL